MVPAWHFPGWPWVSLALASPVAVWGAWPFHRAALAGARHGAATMDTLISVGVTAAYLWSLYALLSGGGRRDVPGGRGGGDRAGPARPPALEARARRRSGAALRALLSLGAKDVAVLRDGTEVRIPVAELAVGDEFAVRPGETIAADGVVIAGRSAVDTSMLTGEPAPAEVGPGDPVTGGCVNAGGHLVVRAGRVGADTQLAQLGRLVAQAQAGKAPVQRLADRISAVFVPVVIGIAVATLAGWLAAGAGAGAAFTAAVAVLIIACPCAMGLATPTAMLTGTGRAAQLGIVIKGPEVLESTRAVDTVALDKTGTVTTGRMSLAEVVAAPGVDADELLRLAGAVEDASEHPIGAAVAAGARERFGGLPGLEDFDSAQGLGVSGCRGRAGRGRRAGGLAVVGMGVAGAGRARGARVRGGGGRADRGVRRRDGAVRGALVVSDTVKPTSAEAVRRLRGLGLSPVLLTGDNERAARSVADAVGIGEVIAGVLPAQGGGDQAAAAGRPGRGDGRRRGQRRRRAGPGRPGPSHGHRHRRRDRGVRPDPGPRRPARRAGRDRSVAAHAGHDQGQPVLGVRLQRGRHPAGGARLPQPADRRGRDGFSSVFVVGNSLRLRRWCPPAARRPARFARSGDRGTEGPSRCGPGRAGTGTGR